MSAEEGKSAEVPAAADEREVLHVCAACSKTGGDLKRCSGCKSIRYCDVNCQRSHRKVHKVECRRRGAELRATAVEVTAAAPADLKVQGAGTDRTCNRYLDKSCTPSLRPDCPLCMLPLPLEEDQSEYQACCGKIICYGCVYDSIRVVVETGCKRGKTEEEVNDEYERMSCPFCRAPRAQSDEVTLTQFRKRITLGVPYAAYTLAGCYSTGNMVEKDEQKALELLHRSAELGCLESAHKLGVTYGIGKYGVEIDEVKAQEYWEQAAQGGHAAAHLCLALQEHEKGNIEAAVPRLRIAASAGYESA